MQQRVKSRYCSNVRSICGLDTFYQKQSNLLKSEGIREFGILTVEEGSNGHFSQIEMIKCSIVSSF